MSFSIDRILHCLPAKTPSASATQLSAEQCCKYWLATSFLPTGGYVMTAPFSTGYPYVETGSHLSPVPRNIHSRSVSEASTTSDTASTSDCRQGSDTEQQQQAPQVRKTPRTKKTRTIFTSEQLQELEKHFCNQKYLSKTDRAKLAASLGLKERQVKTWYQNRRTRWKKDCSDKEWSREKELSAANNYTQYVLMKSQNKN